MSALDRVYQRSPAVVQNVFATAFGVQQRLLRFGGKHRAFVRQLEAQERWSADRLQADQDERLRRMIEFCVAQVPYYRSQFRELGLVPADIRTAADLEKLPILEKEVVRARAHEFVPDTPPERLIAQTTGGTTGTPLSYYVTPSAMQFTYATYEARFRHWAGVRFGERMASINGKPIVPITATRPPFWRSNLAFNQLYLSAYHMSPANLPSYVDRLEKFDPVVVVGYVSTVYNLARHILESGSVGRVRPRAVLVSSETLFPQLRADIEAAFGCRAFNGYSLGELVAFISECPAGSLHISPEYGVVELIDIDGQTELIGTGLFNFGMPLLRYRTGDTVARGDGRVCACGRQLPTVGSITGRVDEYIATPEGVRVGPAPLSLIFQSVPRLKAAQMLQSEVDRVVLRLVEAEGFSSADRDFLLQELRKRLGHGLKIEIERVDHIPKTVRGKQRLVVSTLSRQSTS